MSLVTVAVGYDEEAHVWFVEHSNVPGLRTEAADFDAMKAKLPGMVEELIELNELDIQVPVPVEIIYHARTVAGA